MKNILILLLLAAAAYQVWQRGEPKATVAPLESLSYVAVYGRDSCGWTQRAIRELEKSGANYRYYVVDDQQVADLLHSRMQASGISTRRYNLPVIDVNGELMVRPEMNAVMALYRDKLYQQAGYR